MNRELLSDHSWSGLFGHELIRCCSRCNSQIIILAQRVVYQKKIFRWLNDSFNLGLAKKHINTLWEQNRELLKFFILTGADKIRWD